MSTQTIAGVIAFGALTILAASARAEDVAVCVEVVERYDDGRKVKKEANPQAEKEAEAEPDAGVEAEPDAFPPEAPPPRPQPALARLPRPAPAAYPAAAAEPERTIMPERGPVPLWTSDTKLPLGQTSVVYLKRLFEHFVTHQQGYVAVADGCQQRITVELYPLRQGWTAFARYSGTGREERVDQLFPSELSQYAERAVLALLEDVPISATINRENVLRADSQKSVQRIKGSNHFILNLGTQLRGGSFDTVIEDGEEAGGVEEKIRVFFPLRAGLGYRGRFESWGIEALAQVGIGTNRETSLDENTQGGHIDLGGDAGIGVHFLHYFDPRGLTSFYLGSGATFELLWFRAIKDEEHRDDESRTTLVSGGLDVDGVFGWEFMRASAVQFYLQGELNVPAYAVQCEDSYGSIDTWFPGFSLKLGVVF